MSKLVGDRLRNLRKEAGLSQDGLAEKLKMKRSNIANYEMGRTIPPGHVLIQMVAIFKTTADYLLGVSDERSSLDREHLTPGMWRYVHIASSFPDEERDRLEGLVISYASGLADGCRRGKEEKNLSPDFWEVLERNTEKYDETLKNLKDR